MPRLATGSEKFCGPSGMNAELCYLDTSALAKWYLNEPRSEDFATWIQNQDDTHITRLSRIFPLTSG